MGKPASKTKALKWHFNQQTVEIAEAVYGEIQVGDIYQIPSGAMGQGGEYYVWNGSTWDLKGNTIDDYQGASATKLLQNGAKNWYENFKDAGLRETQYRYINNIKVDREGNITGNDNEPLAIPNMEGIFNGNALVHRYPNDAIYNNTDYVMFNFFEYIPPFGQEANERLEKVYGDFKFSAKDKKNNPFIVGGSLQRYNQTSGILAQRAEGYPTVLLYMPDDVQDAFSAGWQGKSFGNIAAGTISATAGSSDFFDAMGRITKDAGNTFNRINVNAAASAITGLAKSVTGDSITTGDIFGVSQGVIRNPNVELLFEKMTLRTFDHTFKMAPQNQKEEESILAIIKAFKRAMLPSFGIGEVFDKENDSIRAAFVKVPKLCQVVYMRGGDKNPSLPSYKLCAITDVGVNYTPDNNYATFENGGPVAYELKLNFMETKLIFSEEVEQGNH